MSNISRKTEEPYREIYERWLKQKGFESWADYQKQMGEIRSKRGVYRDLGNLIIKRLDETGMSKRELARKMNCSAWIVCMYSDGKVIPKEKNMRRLYEALDLGSYNIISPEEFISYFKNNRKESELPHSKSIASN